MKVTPSKHQLAIFDHIQNSKNNLLVQACAGSGKTTTILGCLELIPPSESVLLLAFNKSIVETLINRAPTTVDIKTFNSIGNSLISRYMGRVTLQANKVRDIVYSYGLDKETGDALVKIIELCKRLNVSLDGSCATLLTPAVMEHIISRFGIPVPKTFNRDKLFDLTRDGLLRNIYMVIENQIIDYDDQLYIPIYRNWEAMRYDWVFVDEAQDISPIRTALLEKHLKDTGRMIAVGDVAQSIYGFTGSTARAMDDLQSRFNCDKLPLSVSYRCPIKVVEEAAKIVPVIEHADNAEEGEVTDLTQIEAKIKIESLSKYDIILCRTNAPLSALAWRLIRARIPVSILGRDIGKNLMILIDSFKTNDIVEMTKKLNDWLNIQLSKYSDNEMMQSTVLDRYESIRCFAEDALDVPSMKRTIEELFSDELSDSKLILSSIHKSKGMEFDHVLILNPELIPIKYAKQEWQIEQEMNLKYVAITRAAKTLSYLKDTQIVNK